MLSDRNILITGGAGSVGRALASRLLDEDHNVIRIFDNNEPGLTELKSQLDDDRCRYLLGDIRDKERLLRAMKDIDIVIHTAAMKHVDISEYNPFEAVKTNVVGLQNVIDTAIDAGVDRLVFTSSDKAANPANTMGTTKLLGEKLVTAGNKYKGRSNLRLASVRFGNVINSSQSVIPVFREQIRNGGPVTLTDTRMTRFFLTYDDIEHLILTAIEKMQGGEVFAHKMPAIRIEDLAHAMIEVFAPKYGYDPSDIEIEMIGRRVGETLHEEIMTGREARRTLENGSLFVVPPEASDHDYFEYDAIDGFERSSDVVRSSEHAPKLDRSGIIDILEENHALEVLP
ncbi:SDR family NAD(P)-dependent oxidoreductase [Haloarcula sp. GH36]|uniref:SDR family NAD(P)-dependent oxidoreductase n=1 Tax=Haloarcula montana TaxID=3111776 RepID=UPI002D76E24C|nr:SDR family NAD(P)-dependent oxidoreductase [Haloarcula sp. GH36]